MRYLLAILLCLAAAPVGAQAPRFIDTQAQFDPVSFDYGGALQTMLSEMDRVGIRKTLIVPPPIQPGNQRGYDAEEIARAIGGRRDRFGFLAGGGTLNVMIHRYAPDEVTDEVRRQFRARCEQILALGALGFGEVTAEHLSLPGMGAHHPHEATAADHPLLLLLADIAAEKDVPIDIHFDIFPETIPVPEHLARGNPSQLKENQAAFERLLAHNRKARFTWAHAGSDPAGQRSPRLMRELLSRHPNLYSALRIVAGGPRRVQALDEDEKLKPQWRELIEAFPDRFTLHTDLFYLSSWPPQRGPKRSHELAVKLLEQLPPPLAAKLAFENAERLYRLDGPRQ